MEKLVVGFDLDLTLIDTVIGFVASLDALAEQLQIELPSAEIAPQIGPPLEQLLAPYLPADEIPAAVDLFREIYPAHAITATPLLAGAVEAIAAVHDLGGEVLVVTGKYQPNAQLHLDQLKLPVEYLVGGVWGIGKAAILRQNQASVYVGDHFHDVTGAKAAGCYSVSVTTGPCTAAELTAAGTDLVLGSLLEFPAWLRGWVSIA